MNFASVLRTRIPNNESLKGIVVEGRSAGTGSEKTPKQPSKREDGPPGGAVAPVGAVPPLVTSNGALFG